MKPRLKPIQDQVVVLVGATSGIGLETAMYMVEKGANVVIVGRSQDGLNDALDQVRTHAQVSLMARGHGSNGQQGVMEGTGEAMTTAYTGEQTAAIEDQVTALEADVTNFDQLKSVADQVVQRFGHFDTWVNMAAVSEWALFEDTSPDEFRRIIDVNLTGQAYGAMAALPYLKQHSSGALIFVSSVAGRIPIPYQAAYNASKHGLLGMVDTLRLELKHTGVPVSVTAILPASIDTPLFDKARTKLGVEPAPVKPVYDVRLAAKAITYAAEHPVRELIVGDAGYVMNFMRRLAPTLTSNYMGMTGFRQQRSDIPKSSDDPDNLYHHIQGYNEPVGEEPMRPMRVSPLTWLSTHPGVRMGIYAALISGAGALVGWRIVKARQMRRSWRYRLPRQARKFSKQAGKALEKAGKTVSKAGKMTEKALQQAGGSMSNMPVVSNLPMFRKRTLMDRFGDLLTGWWAATIAFLPFTRRKSFAQRVSDRLPSVNMPWQQKRSVAERITMANQRKAAAKTIAKATDKVRDRMKSRQKQAGKFVDRTIDRSRKTVKSVAGRVPSAKEIKDMSSKAPVIERRESFMERVSFKR